MSSNEGVELHSHRALHHLPYLLVKNRAGFFSKLFCGCKFRTWNIVHSSLRAKKVNCQRSTSWTCSWTLSSTRRSHPAWSRSHASPKPKHVCANESIDRLTRHVDDGVIRPDLIETFRPRLIRHVDDLCFGQPLHSVKRSVEWPRARFQPPRTTLFTFLLRWIHGPGILASHAEKRSVSPPPLLFQPTHKLSFTN